MLILPQANFMSGGFDVRKFTLLGSANTSLTTTEAQAVALSRGAGTFGEGASLYTVSSGGASDDLVFRYALSTAYLASTHGTGAGVSVASGETVPLAFTISEDGTKFYIAGNPAGNTTIYQYGTGTAHRTELGSYDSTSLDVNGTLGSTCSGLFINAAGTVMYASNNGAIYQFTLSTPLDISTGSYASKSLNVSGQIGNCQDFTFTSDGKNLIALDGNDDTLYQYNLATAWDVSTAAYAGKSLNVTSTENTATGCCISDDDNSLYIIGQQHNDVFQFTLQ